MAREETQNELRAGAAKNNAKGREKSAFHVWQMNLQPKGVSVKLSTPEIQGLTLLISVTQGIALRCSDTFCMTRKGTNSNALKIENTAYVILVV